MYIKSISISNFKKIQNLQLDFQDKFNLIIGDNGSGKTSILEALSVALGGFLSGIDDISTIHFNKDEIRRISNWTGDGSYNAQYKTPTSVTCTLSLNKESFTFTRTKKSLNSSRTTVESRNICRKAMELTEDDYSVLPVISYQSAARMWQQKKDKWNNPFSDDYSRVIGYVDCLDESSNTKMLTNWCKRMEQVSWQLNKKIGEYESVKAAVSRFISRMIDTNEVEVGYDKRSEELMCRIENEFLPLRLLSSGYRSMIGMVFDIAYRMAILNPNLLKETYMTSGVVLIDELELHLHPDWQWKIIDALKETFPNVQFIATTHSPVILSSYKGNQVIYIDEYCNVEYKQPTYGYQVNDVLAILQNSNMRVPKISSNFKEFYTAIDENNIVLAEEILNKLKEELHNDDPDIVGAQTTLDLEKIDL